MCSIKRLYKRVERGKAGKGAIVQNDTIWLDQYVDDIIATTQIINL